MSDRPANTIVGHIRNGFLARMMHYSPPAVLVWLALANRADESGYCHPSVSLLQADTGLARSTVHKAIGELAGSGEITVVPGCGIGKSSNQYHIEGSPQNELVQSADRSEPRTGVVQSADGGSPRIGLKPNARTKHKNQTVGRATPKTAKFVPPTVEEVAAYCRERHNTINPEEFVDYYKKNGWMAGRYSMKDWQAAVRTWERNGYGNSTTNAKTDPGPRFFDDEEPRA